MKQNHNFRLNQAMEWLNKEVIKDNKDISRDKEKLIKEIKSFDRSTIIKEINSINKTEKMYKKKRLSFFKKIQIILGYGKKG